MSLFRKEAINHQQESRWGHVNLVQPVSFKYLSIALISFLLILLTYLVVSPYSQKQAVYGYLLPTQGVTKLYAPDLVYIDEIYVEEGDFVHKNQPLAKLTYRQQLNSGVAVQAELKKEYETQLHLLSQQKLKAQDIQKNKRLEYQQKIHEIDEQIRLSNRQQTQLKKRIDVVRERVKKYQTLQKQGHIAKIAVEKERDSQLMLEQSLANLQASESQSQQERQSLQLALKRLPTELQQTLQELDLKISTKHTQLTELAGRTEVLMTASKEGRITALNIQTGQLLKPQQYMLSLLPKDAELYVELLIPTRAFGFVQEGQKTYIKLDAFPYQKFGMLEATIVETSEYVILPKEIQLAIEFKEPVYKVKAKLDSQAILAYGKEVPLQAGMSLRADILLDERSLMEWLFEPLLSLKGTS